MKPIKTYKKILLVRPEMMGDTILLTPVISLIKKYLPETKIFMLLQHPMEEVIKNNQEVAGCILTKKNLNLFEYLQLVAKIKQEKFDLSIVFEDNPTPNLALLCFLAGIPNRIGDKSRLLYSWIYNKGAWLNSADPKLHHIELYLDLLKPLNLPLEYLPLKLNLETQAENKIRDLLPVKKSAAEKFIGLHIGTGGGNKALLPKTYAEIAAGLQEKLHGKIILIGGGKELSTLNGMQKYLKQPFIDTVNKLSLQELFALIKNLDLFIGVDSGPLHIAAALKIPIIAIYTAKDVNPNRWLPWMTKYAMIKNEAPCPIKCSHRECNLDYCQKGISAIKIIEEADKLLKNE